MNRSSSSSSLAVVVALALVCALAPAASPAAPGSADSAQAQVSAKKRGGKKKASTCTKRRSAKGKRDKPRRGAAAAEASARKGKKRAKRCATRRSTPKRQSGNDRRQRPSRDPRERRRQREEAKGGHGGRPHPTRPTPRAPATVVPADGTYTSAAVPGLTFTISGGGRSGRILYTVPKSAFSEVVCQTEDVAVDLPVEISRSTGRSGVIGDEQLPGGGLVDVLGFVDATGAFGFSLGASHPYAADPSATCSANVRLEGTLAR